MTRQHALRMGGCRYNPSNSAPLFTKSRTRVVELPILMSLGAAAATTASYAADRGARSSVRTGTGMMVKPSSSNSRRVLAGSSILSMTALRQSWIRSAVSSSSSHNRIAAKCSFGTRSILTVAPGSRVIRNLRVLLRSACNGVVFTYRPVLMDARGPAKARAALQSLHNISASARRT